MANPQIVQSKKSLEHVEGLPTLTVCSNFGNKIMIFVTQYGRIGTMVSAEVDGLSHGEYSTDSMSSIYTVKVLFGMEEPAYIVLARQLIEEIFRSSNKNSILLAISLKDKSIPSLKCLKNVIIANRTW